MLKHIFLLFLLVVSMFTGLAHSYWRMSCMGVVGVGRMDPIVSPGKISAHVHTFKGASGLTQNVTADQLLASNCSSCEIKQDKSAYWTPQLYFHDSTNNSFELVEETGGALVYYKMVPATTSNGFTQPKPIPNGMRMLSGNPFRRNFTLQVPDPPMPWYGKDATQAALAQKAIGFNCMNYDKGRREGKDEPTLFRHGMPDKAYLDANCPDGLRFEVLFPICWNGRDLSPEDLTSHLAYSSASANGGSCPPGFDTVINQILFETIYPVGNYKDRQGNFVLSNGDPTGESSSQHVLPDTTLLLTHS